MYKAVAQRHLPLGAEQAEFLDFGQLWRNPDYATITHYVDCETAVYDFPPPHRPKGANRRNPRHPALLSPFCFCPGTSRTFPTVYSCVSVRSRCRRPPGTGRHWNTDLRRRPPPQNREDRGARRPDAPNHRSDRGDLPRSGTSAARSEQALRRLRLPAEVSRRRYRT